MVLSHVAVTASPKRSYKVVVKETCSQANEISSNCILCSALHRQTDTWKHHLTVLSTG